MLVLSKQIYFNYFNTTNRAISNDRLKKNKQLLKDS